MNTTRPFARSALRWFLALLAFGFVGSLWAPSAAAADNSLAKSEPAAGSSVDQSPTQLTLTFAQPLAATQNTVDMTCDGGKIVPLGSPTLLKGEVTLQVPLVAVAPKGDCVVVWKVFDLNLQPAGTGNYTFTVANAPVETTTTIAVTTTTQTGDTIVPREESTTTVTTGAPATGGDTSGGSSADSGSSDTGGGQGPLSLFRLASNFGLAVLFGSLGLIAVAWPEGVEYILTVRFLKTAWLFTLASSYLFVGAVAANQAGAGIGSSLVPTGWGGIMDSTPGKAAILRLVFVAISAYAVLRPERVIDPSSQLPALVPPGVAVVTIAFTRDAFTLLENATGAVHALAMAVWLGGLVLLTRVVLAGPGEEDLVHAVRGFARIATPALLATVLTGIIQFAQLDRGGLTTSHGLVLLVKTLFVCLMVFVGLTARQFIAQRVSRVDTMTAQLAMKLKRALGIEAVLGVVVLLFTAWLLALTPPGLASSGGTPGLQLGVTHRFLSADGTIEVDVSFSERVGLNDVLIKVVTPPTGLTGLAVNFIPPPGSTVPGMTINNTGLTGAGAVLLEKRDGFSLKASGTWTISVQANGIEVAATNVSVNGTSPTVVTTPTATT